MKREAFTLAELMIAALVLTVGLIGVLSMYTCSIFSIQTAKNLTIAAEDASSVFENAKTLTLAQISSHNGDDAYWNSLITPTLDAESVTVINTDASDVTWSNDPLELKVTVAWNERGGNKSIEMVTKFTD